MYVCMYVLCIYVYKKYLNAALQADSPESLVEALSRTLQTNDLIEELRAVSTLDNPVLSTTLSFKAH